MNDELIKDILNHLNCPPHAPTLQFLNRLIHSYIRRVPWESVSRIVKRRATAETKHCPRLPEEFWREALQYGLGGTCYESSLAFYSLLEALGYQGYLTVNDMGETRGCHAAIIVLLKGRKYLVDITIPVHAAIHVEPRTITRRRTLIHDYTIRPTGENSYAVQRSHHPNRTSFTLIDVPVGLSEYQKIVENDYLETGYFLKSVVMVKVVDDESWRFFSDHQPYALERFNRTGKYETILAPDRVARSLARKFHMPEDQIAAALAITSQPGLKRGSP